jgi:hypothetical protein
MTCAEHALVERAVKLGMPVPDHTDKSDDNLRQFFFFDPALSWNLEIACLDYVTRQMRKVMVISGETDHENEDQLLRHAKLLKSYPRATPCKAGHSSIIGLHVYIL